MNIFKKKIKNSSEKDALLEKIVSIFKNEAYCKNGFWNWANQEVDLVFPEVALWDPENRKWIGVGLVFHVYELSDASDVQPLVLSCIKNQVTLVSIKKDKVLSISEIIAEIEKAFQNKLLVPRVPVE